MTKDRQRNRKVKSEYGRTSGYYNHNYDFWFSDEIEKHYTSRRVSKRREAPG